MKIIGNLLWLLFGGFLTALEYIIASFILMVTVVGIPFGLQTIKLASLAMWPFGREVRQSKEASGCLSSVMNVLWILFGGIWISLTHLLFALILAITVIGIPFAIQHAKLAGLALTPFGRVIVEKE